MRVRWRLVGSIRAVNQLMKIIEQGHCGGSEQKEGKWPWRHSIGKTPELPLCSRECWKQTRSHPEWETALRRSRPSPDGPGPVPRGTPWAMPPLRCQGQPGAWWVLTRPRPVAKTARHSKTLLLRPKSVVNRGSRCPRSSLLPGKELADAYLCDRREQHQRGLHTHRHHLCTRRLVPGRHRPSISEKERKFISRSSGEGGEWRNRKTCKWREWERKRATEGWGERNRQQARVKER